LAYYSWPLTTYGECLEVLAECKRILVPGGTLRLILPDAGKYLTLYQKAMSGEEVIFPYPELDSTEGFTPMVAVNRIFRSFGHQYAYDIDTISTMLDGAGFSSVTKTEFMKSGDKNLLLDSEIREAESLYVEAVA